MPPTDKALRTEAERNALEMLRARAALIGDASVARQRRDDLAAQHAAAAEEYTALYDKARAEGWSVDELARLGLPSPEPRGGDTSRRRRTSGRTGEGQPVEPNEPASTP